MAKYTLDVGQRGRQLTIEGLHVGDNGFRIFDFSFSERGKPFPLPEGCIATIYATLPGGVTIYETCTIEDDSALYELRGGTDDPSITAKSGKVNCEIRITDSEGNVITSPKFAFIIDKVLQDDDAIEAQESFSALTDALARTERAVDEAQNAVDDARAAALSAENAVSIAGDAVRLADSVAAKATEAANNAKEAAEKSNIAAENANNAVKKAEDALDRTENAETVLGSKLDKVEGTEGNMVVFGPDGTITDGGAPSKIYVIDYNGTDTSINNALESMLSETSPFSVVIKDANYLIPAMAFIANRGISYIVGVLHDGSTSANDFKYTIKITAARAITRTKEPYAVNGGSGGGISEETDPTVSDWAKQPTKPTYTASEVGALPNDTKIPTIPTKLSDFENDEGFITEAPVKSVNGKTGAVNLSASDVNALPDTYTPPDQTAEQVGADPKGTADSTVSAHNTSNTSHNDIRLLISGLTTRLNTLANSTDEDLDQLSEIVAYIKSNKSLIDSITTSKVSVSDIINNLTTEVSNKPLSAAQGVALKALIDAITVPTKLSQLSGDSTHRVVTDAEKTAWNAKSNFSGAYADLTGKPTIPTVPTNVSAFDNDKGYLTSVPSEYITESELNAKGYLTQHQDISGKVDKAGLTLGRQGDGLLYVFVDGQPVGDGVDLPAGGIDGYITPDKQIVFNNLPDGEYTLAYINDDGSIVPIGAMEKDANVYYTVTNTLTQCTTNNSATKAVRGSAYSATITANSGYELKSVTVTMGGNNVSVSGGNINIANVTGKIVITAVAEEIKAAEPVTENITVLKDVSLKGTNFDEDRTGTTGYCATSSIDLTNIPKPCVIRLTGACWSNYNASDSSYIRFSVLNTSGSKLAGDYTHSSKMPSGVTMVYNTENRQDVSITVTGNNIGKVRFAGCYGTAGNNSGSGDFADVTATLTYTPAS